MLRYAATIFLSAFLLFLVQPLIGKFILPWFGGGSGVWTACLLFFQCVLLVGYLYAHLLVRFFTPAQQLIMHVVLIAGAAIFLPIVPRDGFKPLDASQPVLHIVIMLAATIGVPYLALSSTGPLLQAWFARTHPTRSPYRLYALSNLGSLLALIGYPFLMEPALTRSMQAYVWSGGFVAFAALCGWCAMAQRRSIVPVEVAPSPRPSPSAKRGKGVASAVGRGRGGTVAAASSEQKRTTSFERALWILLPMCSSIMLLAMTTQLTEEIAPMPFVWVLPLATYLITFIIAFEWPRLYDRRVFVGLALAAPWIYLAALVDTEASLATQIALLSVVLFAVCMVCHGEAYRLRPPPAKLTGYYLAISFGGALGGVFVAVIAPLIFSSNLEFHVALFGSIALLIACLLHDASSPMHRGKARPAWLGMILISAFAGYLIRAHTEAWNANTVKQVRSFYGSLRVRIFEDHPAWAYLKLEHGRIAHGAQALDPTMRRRPLMYYSPNSGIGMAMALYPQLGPRRVAIVGLGTGSMAAFGRAGDVFRFYEINPQVVEIAHDPFTYLSDGVATTEIVMGDARLSMEREPPQKYDIIVLDAFSGDAVPMHLLTREAFAVYRRHLKPDGVIAVHVTNRYLDLDQVVRGAARELGMSTIFVMARARELPHTSTSLWTLMTSNAAMLQSKEFIAAGVRPSTEAAGVLWTDDYCSVLDVLRRR